jgi:hypothetical protein
MGAFLVTLVLLGCCLLWIRALLRGSRLAIGLAVGVVLALLAAPVARSVATLDHLPVWVPALPFAAIAISLFVFGLLAWYWGED